MLEMPQTNARMCPPTAGLYELITTRRLAHDGDPAFARHIASAVEVTTQDGKTRLAKYRGKRRTMIDAAIGLVMAVGLALGEQPTETEAEPGIYSLDDIEAE